MHRCLYKPKLDNSIGDTSHIPGFGTYRLLAHSERACKIINALNAHLYLPQIHNILQMNMYMYRLSTHCTIKPKILCPTPTSTNTSKRRASRHVIDIAWAIEHTIVHTFCIVK